jgi:hypothetical protein
LRLKPFPLNLWLDTFEHGIEFNLAASAGPTWTADEPLDLRAANNAGTSTANHSRLKTDCLP